MTIQWYDFSLHVEERERNAGYFQTSDEDIGGLVGCHLKLGNLIEDWNPNYWIASRRRKDDGVPDDVLSEHLGVPAFSKRLQRAIDKAGIGRNDIQYLPIRVFKSTGEDIEGYAYANVISRVKALDYVNSDWGELPPDPDEIDPATGRPTVQAIWKAALTTAALKGHDIIRLVEFFPPVFVSEGFAEVYRKGSFTGATLTPVMMT